MRFIKDLIAKIKAWFANLGKDEVEVPTPVTASPVEPSRPLPGPSIDSMPSRPPGYPPLNYGHTTYNPDNYTDVGYRYQAWVAAGRPVKDILGRDLDVRGDWAQRAFADFGPADFGPLPPAKTKEQVDERIRLAGAILRGDMYTSKEFIKAGLDPVNGTHFVYLVKNNRPYL